MKQQSKRKGNGETEIQNSMNARSALTECYVHVRHNILELTECYVNKNKTILGDPGQQMHDSDYTECYVHVKHNILEDPGQQMYDSALICSFETQLYSRRPRKTQMHDHS